MKTKTAIQTTSITRIGRFALVLAFGATALSGQPVFAQFAFTGKEYSVFSAECSNCGRSVGVFSKPGDRCPHCGTFWSAERTSYHSSPSSSDVNGPTKDESRLAKRSDGGVALKPSSRKCWPRFAHTLRGFSHLRFENHTGTKLWVGLRSGPSGSDLRIPANANGNFALPPGTYQIYVFRFDSPTALFEAGEVTIEDCSSSSLCLLDVQY